MFFGFKLARLSKKRELQSFASGPCKVIVKQEFCIRATMHRRVARRAAEEVDAQNGTENQLDSNGGRKSFWDAHGVELEAKLVLDFNVAPTGA